jgi:hypothetical protein
MIIFAPQLHADMVKLVDMPDLGSGAARRVGSSPIIRTKPLTHKELRVFCFYSSQYLVSNCKKAKYFTFYELDKLF